MQRPASGFCCVGPVDWGGLEAQLDFRTCEDACWHLLACVGNSLFWPSGDESMQVSLGIAHIKSRAQGGKACHFQNQSLKCSNQFEMSSTASPNKLVSSSSAMPPVRTAACTSTQALGNTAECQSRQSLQPWHRSLLGCGWEISLCLTQALECHSV